MKRSFDAGNRGAPPAKRPQPAKNTLFSNTDYILIIGESDFSFSLKLAQTVGGSNILSSTLSGYQETTRIYPGATANISALGMARCSAFSRTSPNTEYHQYRTFAAEKYGAVVNYDLDCTTNKLMQLDLQFDKIVFNFPETVTGPDELELAVPYNQYLLAGFLYEGARLLMPHGKIYVAMKTGWPFDLWDVKKQVCLHTFSA